MITVSARDLWWQEPHVCECEIPPTAEFPCVCGSAGGWQERLLIGEINGWQYLTDRCMFLPIARLGDLPVGYSEVLDLEPLPRQAVDGLAEWLTATAAAEPSPRLFHPSRIEPLEKAGFRVRPLEGVADAHGICDPDLTVVGLVSPIMRRLEDDAATGCRVAS